MRTCKLFRYLLATIMALSTTSNAMADEVEFLFGSNTVELKKNGTEPQIVPNEISLTNFTTFDYLHVLSTDWIKTGNGVDHKTLEDNTASINFGSTFKYEVTEVAWQRFTRWAGDFTRIRVNVKDLAGNTVYSNSDYLVDRNEPDYTTLSNSTFNGLSLMEITIPKGITTRDIVVLGLKISYNKPDIRIRFANGYKGYDVSVGDTKCKIEGYIADHAGTFKVGEENVHFEYTEDSNGEIISIDSSTGKITPKKEGDVVVTAILKQGDIEINSYNYTLHVFAKGEGLTWSRYAPLYNNSTDNINSTTITGTTRTSTDWYQASKLKVQTTVWENESGSQSSDQFKQIACFEAPSKASWRAVAQKLSCNIMVPKYSRVSSTLNFGANATLGSQATKDITYGYEFIDMGIKTSPTLSFGDASTKADQFLNELVWDTYNSTETASSVGNYRTASKDNITYLRNGAHEYRKYNIITAWNNGQGYVGDHYLAGEHWNYDNTDGAEGTSETRFFAAMGFIHKDVKYSATLSMGYQDIPTYTYYSYIKYYKNYETDATKDYLGEETLYSVGKTAVQEMNVVVLVPTRDCYEFLGWSRDKNATVPEYTQVDRFCSYDAENGGGLGHIELYAVWKPYNYTATLIRNRSTSDKTKLGTITVTYGENPDKVAVPEPWETEMTFEDGNGFTRKDKWQYVFHGYYDRPTSNNIDDDEHRYFDANGNPTKAWDKDKNANLYAYWVSVKEGNYYFITFDANGGTLNSKLKSMLPLSNIDDVQVKSDCKTMSAFVQEDKTYSNKIYLDNGAVGEPITRDGYEFEGWYDAKTGGNMVYSYSGKDKFLAVEGDYWNGSEDNATWKGTSAITLYARWTANEYKVTLNNNGGKNGLSSVTATYNQTLPKITKLPTKQGYTFEGYYQNNNSADRGIQYYKADGTSEQVWTLESNDETIYAMWAFKPYDIVYHSNYDPDKTEKQTIANESTAINKSMSRAGYTLTGWNLTPSVSVGSNPSYKNGDVINRAKQAINEETGELDLYAVWAANEYKVTLNKNQGTGGTSSVTATYGEMLPKNWVAPTRDGFIFMGYYDSKEGGNQYYDENMNPVKVWDKATNGTLYAQWRTFAVADGIKSYCDTNLKNSITVGELVHNDDYTFSYEADEATSPDKTWSSIGKLTSTKNNDYRVGFQLVKFSSGKIPAYTTIEAKYMFAVKSTIDGTSTKGYGGEIFASAHGYQSEYGSDFLLRTQNGTLSNDCSVYRQWSDKNKSKTFKIDYNANGATDIEDYPFYLALMASTRTDKDIVHTANYWYKSSTNKKIYHAYISFDANGGTGGPMEKQNIGLSSDKTANLNANVFTREGYVFKGWSTTANGTVEYKDKGKFESYITGEDNVKRGKGPVTLYAVWEKRVTVITLDRNGAPEKTEWGGDNGQTSVEATYGDPIPTISSIPSRPGYDYLGYYDKATGGTKYYSWYSEKNWDKNVDKATLYAHWSPKTVRVIFNYTDPSKNIIHASTQLEGYVTGSDDKASLGTSVETPTYEDYIFDGWYEQDGKNKTYDADGNAVEGKYWIKDGDRLVWQSENDVQLYPQWIKDATIVDVKVIRSNNYEGDASHNYVGVTLNGMTTVSNFRGKGYITVDGVNFLSYEKNGGEDQLKSVPLEEAPVWTIQSVEGSTEKVLIYSETSTGRKYLGNKIANGEVIDDAIGIEDNQPGFYFTIYNEKAWICLDDKAGQKYNHILYMKDNTAWEYENTGDNPQYKPIRILAYGTSSSYGKLNSAKVVKAIKDKLATKDENGKYPYAYNPDNTNDLCKGLLYVDMGGAASIVDANANDLSNFKNEASANCLFFVPDNYTNSALGSNVVCKDGDDYKAAADLVITDKVPFSSPYEFSVGGVYKASYTRNNTGTWGSMCLPFPVKNEGTDGTVRFYQLYGSDDLRLAYKAVVDDIPANKPIAYSTSTIGDITFENSNITVPADPSDLKEKVSAFTSENIREFAKDSENEKDAEGQDWNVVGVRFCKYVYGNSNPATLPDADNVERGLVYYFSNGKFTYVNQAGRVKFTPFRAYYQPGDGSAVKSFSVIALDEEGATDITDIVAGAEAEGDGKIYDLNGIRVMHPVKGSLYIVNGKKKVYK